MASPPPDHPASSQGNSRHAEQSPSPIEPALSENHPDAVNLRARAFKAMPEAVVVTDAAHRIVLVNPSFETITGYSLPEVRGRTCALLQGPLTDAATVREMDQALRQQFAFAGPVLNYRKDGSTFWNDLSISALHDPQGELTHFIGLMRDVSQRVHDDNALLEAENRYRHATEAAGGFILDVDTDIRYTYVSKRAEQLLGYASHEMLGRTPAAFMPPGEIEKVKAWLDSHLKIDGAIHGLEHRVLTKSGSMIWMQISRIPIRNHHGETTGYRGIAFDITARKLAEQIATEREAHLRETQKMEAIGTLAGGIAHDFNNIIAAILGNVSLALQDVSPNSPAVQSLEEIDKAASRARELVRQILAFSRRQATEYEQIALPPIVAEVARTLRATLPGRITIGTDCVESAPEVLGDAAQLQQVLVNLTTNATQAIGDGAGHINVAVDMPQPDEQTLAKHPTLRVLLKNNPEGLVRLTVSDDGPGMEYPIQSRIFEPFFSTKPVGEGTGLGLAVVHGIAQGHNGLILVDSQPGTGARFALYLPAARDTGEKTSEAHRPQLRQTSARTPPLRAETPGATPAHRTHIVYVDDDESLLFLVKRLLERRGYRVSAHEEQQSALDAIRADPAGVDLVLTDYNMPGMSGLDLARKARTIRPDLLIAVTSGFIDERLNAEAAEAGIHKLIFKAVAVEDFCSAIAALLPVNP
jgi:PAS domain S-box-containing protein